MTGGVNFQPGSMEQERDQRLQTRGTSEGVQEAVKVLSLRLPKVLGAQALAPSALLNAPGGMGRPGIDSLVEKVLARFFPGGSGAAPGAQAPVVPSPVTPSPMVPQSGGGAPTLWPSESHTMPPSLRGAFDGPSQGPAPDTGNDAWLNPKGPRIVPGYQQPPHPPTPPAPPDLRRQMEWLPHSPQDPYSI
jgi:hypothetical protein